MKSFLLSLVLVHIAGAAFAGSNCEVNVFGKLISGAGRNDSAAKVDTRIKCIQAGNSANFCSFDKITCTSAAETPASYCEVVAVTDYFFSIQANRQLAADDTRRQCLQKENAMFCEPSKITCLDF